MESIVADGVFRIPSIQYEVVRYCILPVISAIRCVHLQVLPVVSCPNNSDDVYALSGLNQAWDARHE